MRFRGLLICCVLVLCLPIGLSVVTAQDDEAETPIARVIAWRLNARSAPSLDAEVLAVLELGQEFRIVGRTEAADWLNIQLSTDQTAWIASRYTEETISRNLPIVTAELPSENGVIRVSQDVNVRAGAGVRFPIVNGLPRSTQVTVIGRSGDNTWAQIIQPNGSTGWIFDGALPIDFDLTPFPVPASALIGAQWRTINTVPVRVGPEAFYPLLEFLNEGTLVTILGRDTTSQWVKISFPISNGWIPAAAFPEGTNISTLPISLN